MKSISVKISEKARKILDDFQHEKKLSLLDDAVDQIILQSRPDNEEKNRLDKLR